MWLNATALATSTSNETLAFEALHKIGRCCCGIDIIRSRHHDNLSCLLKNPSVQLHHGLPNAFSGAFYVGWALWKAKPMIGPRMHL